MNSAPLRLAPIGVWTAAFRALPTTQAQELAVELEELGYGAIWVPESDGRDPFVLLSLLLSATRRIVGASGVATIWGRDPIAMVGAITALTEAFPERVLAGLGVSHEVMVGVRGQTYDRPLTNMRQYLDRMDAVQYSAIAPTTPVHRVLAALGPKMLRLAAERTHGAHPYNVPPEHSAIARLALGPAPMLCPEQAVLLETDPQRAREIARTRYVAFYTQLPNYMNNLRQFGLTDDDFADGGSDRLVDTLVAWGTIEQIADRVRAHFDGGADHVAIQVVSDNPTVAPLEQWKELAPALRELRTRQA
jgi:probable F420-dependent oxidoreductase